MVKGKLKDRAKKISAAIGVILFSSSIFFQSISVAFAVPKADGQVLPKHEITERTITASSATVFKADQSFIWHALIDFQNYPAIFKRIDSTEIVKRDGNFVYVESNLKPHIFIKHSTQHIVNDLSAAPHQLKWHMLDGNFNYVDGKWEIQPRSANSCLVKYTLIAEPGAVIPAPLISLIVHHIQHEILEQFKHYVEVEFKKKLEAMN